MRTALNKSYRNTSVFFKSLLWKIKEKFATANPFQTVFFKNALVHTENSKEQLRLETVQFVLLTCRAFRASVRNECQVGSGHSQSLAAERLEGTVLLSGCIHLSQTNGGVKLSLFIYPCRRESSIFQSQAAGKRLRREVSDPDDFSGTATNCETEIDFENTCRVPGRLRGGFSGLCNQIYTRRTPMNILSFWRRVGWRRQGGEGRHFRV